MPSPSIEARTLNRIPTDDALRLVDDLLGRSEEWRSALVGYRLASKGQRDWKEQVGQWLATAGRLGFQRPLVDGIVKAARRGTKSVGIDPNDRSHTKLHQALAPAIVVHYLTNTGWTFQSWEPKGDPRYAIPSERDVDIVLTAPSGTDVFIQVKASDQPGRHEGHRIVDGEYDERVITGMRNAAEQLPVNGTEAKLIVLCANRGWVVSCAPAFIITETMGASVQEDDVVYMDRSNLGCFWTPTWSHVSGVVALDLLRSERTTYTCTVLLNPNAKVSAAAEWFAHGRVCRVVHGTFEWVRGQPGDACGLPSGTRIR